jgi:cytohesin
MKTSSFLSRFFHSPIARLSTLLLIMLPWSVHAFSQKAKAPDAVNVPTFGIPIHAAAKDGDLEKVKALLSDNPELVSSRDQGWTPLHVAVEFGKKDVAELLLVNKADINAKVLVTMSSGSDTLLALTYRTIYGDSTPIRLAVAQGNKDVVELLLAMGADINMKDNLVGVTPLFLAVEAAEKDIAELLLVNKADVNSMTNFGYTPLHEAVLRGDKDMVELLLAKGANVNARNANAMLDNLGYAPLHMARNKDIVELLLTKGADANVKDNAGLTPLHSAADKRIAELLLAKGADVNVKNNAGMTPLHRATSKVAELLLAKRADVNARDKSGDTPLHNAASGFSKDIVEVLLANGADINARNDDGRTPLHMAVRGHGMFQNRTPGDNNSVVEFLLVNKADANALDGDGHTPLYWAARDGRAKDIAELLRQHSGHE